MSFKKYNPVIKETLTNLGFESPNTFQSKVLPKIKGGSHLFAIGPKGAGKTTSIIISTVHKLNAEAKGDSPRAIILVKDKAAALQLEEDFKTFTNSTDLRLFTLYEEQNINDQKDQIYYGADIVIATPKRLNKLYFLNGIHLGELQLFIVEDADFLIRNDFHTDVARISESLNKCQHLIFAEQFNNRLEILQDTIMQNSIVIHVK